MKGDILISITPWKQSDFKRGTKGYDGRCSGPGSVACQFQERAIFTGEFNTGKWAQCLSHAFEALAEHAERQELEEETG